MSQWRSEVEGQRTNGTDGDHFRPVFLFWPDSRNRDAPETGMEEG